MKYWFVSYTYRRHGRDTVNYTSTVLKEEHPFAWLAKSNRDSAYEHSIISFQEISEEEYQFYYDNM